MAGKAERARQAELAVSRQRLFDLPSLRHSNFAMRAPERNARVTSSALTKVEDPSTKKLGGRSAARAKQSRAYELLDEVGELGYLMGLKASLVARCNFTPEWLTDEGKWDSVPDDDRKPLRVMNSFAGPQGGQTELKRQAALHLAVAGECYLTGTPVPVDLMDDVNHDGNPLDDVPEAVYAGPDEEVEDDMTAAGAANGLLWEFLSVDELQIDIDGEVQRRRSAIGELEDIDKKKTYIARLWRPSARFTDDPDCEVFRIIRIAEEILTLTQMVDAIASSRLAAGILYVPDEISFVDEDADEAAEGDEAPDPFTMALMEHMAAPKADPDSAASLVPLVVRGPADMVDNIKLIDLARQLDDWAQSLRKEALSRLAQGLDAPPEMMTGLGAVNHWGSFQVDADFASKHIAPLGEMLAEFLSFAYFRPMLEEFEGVSATDSKRYRLVFDLTPIAARKDEAAAGARLHGDELISDEAYVKSAGYTDADRPLPEELTQRRMWHLIAQAPSTFAPIFLDKIDGFEDFDLSALQQSGGLGGGGGGGASGPTGLTPDGERVQDAQTAQEPPRTPVPGFSSDLATLALTLGVAADAALERALEKAGARLVTKTTKNEEMKARLRAVPKARALELVTAKELKSLGVSLDDITKDAWSTLAVRTTEWVVAYLTDQGMSELSASDHAALAASTLCAAMQEFVADNAHAGFPVGPNRLRVPDALVLRALGTVVGAYVAA
jgi:hypothetical protein